MDWKDGRAAGGGSCSLALAKACVIPAVSGTGIRAGGVGGVGGVADATRTRRSFGTAFTRAVATVTGGGNGGAVVAAAATLPVAVTPPCAKATARAESKSFASLL